MKAHYKRILRDAEKNVERSLAIQDLREGSPWHGAFSQPDGVYQAKYAIYRVSTMIAASSGVRSCRAVRYCRWGTIFTTQKAVSGAEKKLQVT